MSSEISQSIVEILAEAGIDFFAMLPCEKVKRLYQITARRFRHVILSREEEGVGICAGAYFAGAKPAMLVQSSGIGNMMNALCSLTLTYQLPLLILVSWRGVYKEKIPAQVPLGENLPKILRAVGIKHSVIEDGRDVPRIAEAALKAYEDNEVRAVLLSPSIWEHEVPTSDNTGESRNTKAAHAQTIERSRHPEPILTRLEILKTAIPYLEGKVVVCNLGIPCKELHSVINQKSNFYMLGSMGLASSIGLGISLFTSKHVTVIEGDGSILTNLGALSTIAIAEPSNLTILAIDNGVHGSTGNQATATSHGVDLATTATGLGIRRVFKVASRVEILSVLEDCLKGGPNFVHVIAKPGNVDLPDVPLTPTHIKSNVMEALREWGNS